MRVSKKNSVWNQTFIFWKIFATKPKFRNLTATDSVPFILSLSEKLLHFFALFVLAKNGGSCYLSWATSIFFILVIKSFYIRNIWVKVVKNGPSKICGRQPLKSLKWWYGLLRQTISLQILKGCLPLILLGPFLNTLTHISHIMQLFHAFLLSIKNHSPESELNIISWVNKFDI